MSKATGFVQVMYVAVIALLIATLLATTISAVAVGLKKFDRYWQSGFPVLLALFLLGYGLFKMPLLPIPILVGSGSFVLGCFVAQRLPNRWLQFVPAATTLIVLLGGEALAITPDIRASLFLLSAGLMTAATVKGRALQTGDD